MTIQSVSSGSVQPNVAGQAPSKVSGKRNTTAPNQVGDKKAMRNAEQAQAQKPEAMNPRLAAYARNIDARLKLAIEGAAGNPREQAALQAAQTHFHSMVLRLDDAFFTGGNPKVDMAPGDAMSRVLDHLTGAVQTVLSHGSVDVKG
jgi:hypothetical protein